ncbi:MAG: peptidylprolyl isomerase [Myxococcales bacterium]|nr:peptidylprolyl isomerase [Myxococcales bacterium]
MKRWVVGSVASFLALGAITHSGCKKSEETKPPVTENAPKTAEVAVPDAGKKEEPVVDAGSTTVETAKPDVVAGEKITRIEGPVATVNGKPVDSDEYYAELEKITQHGAKIPEDRMTRIRENILKRLIEAELVNQAIAKESIVVPDEDVQKEYDDYKSRFKSDEQFQNYLKHGKITEDDIKARIKDKRALEMLIAKKGTLTVDDAEARDFYDKNQRFYLEKEAVRASHILVKLENEATPEQDAEAKKKIEEIQAALKDGADFTELANKYSEGPSAPSGGDLGFFSRGQMVKPFEDVAFAMKPGDVSEPVRTRFGYHIIKVFEKREDKQKTYEEVKDQIFESLKNKKFFQERRTLLEKLEQEAKVEKFVK